MAIQIKEIIRTKAQCVVTITVLLVFQAGKFTFPTQTIAGEEMSIVTINRALTGKLYVDMNEVFQCGYEKLLEELVYPSGVSTSQAAVQVTYFTLYKHLKKYNLSQEIKLCDMIKDL